MDKLEKAVQKARQNRQTATGNMGASAQPGGTNEASLLPPIPIPDDQIRAEEEFLERSRVVAHRTRHKDADIFRILRTQVLQSMANADHRSLAITSPNYRDGKTTVAFNLALSIAQDVKQTVLLVDLDLRKPDLHNYVGLESPPGLSDYLIHNTPLSDCLYRTSFERFSILPSGRSLDNSSEVLGSPKMAALAEELERRYHDRLIIYDMPPILAQDDSIAFFPHVGAVLLVVRDGVTKIADIKQSINALSGAHLIGTVLNKVAA
jgi:capsular exopolysaccharide synthesis family protein